MRYLTPDEVIRLHALILRESRGAEGIRDVRAIDSAVAQPQMAFGGQELYPALADKAAALAFSLVRNHPFVDGNKRVGHAATEVFLVLNGHEIRASADEQEELILRLAAGQLSRDELREWLRAHSAIHE